MTAFLNPKEASYARLGNSSAPDKADWASGGYSELLHIDTYRGKTHVELRSPDAESNPYLVYALLIHAGLAGIERKLELPREMDEDAALLPTSKKEAGKIACHSEFIKSIIPEGIIREYTGC